VTFTAGFIGGGIQSVIAAPFDALQTRFRTADILDGKHKTMWHYAGHKLRSIGIQGIFAGWSLSFTKDAFGAAVFFGTFETVKSQAYLEFVSRYYGSRTRDTLLEKSIPYLQEDTMTAPSSDLTICSNPCFSSWLASLRQSLLSSSNTLLPRFKTCTTAG
jgi:hypothetical protein